MVSLQRKRQMQVGQVKLRFSTNQEVYVSVALPPKICPSATVVRVHDGKLAEKYVVSSTTFVV